jgi:hypothetical protein
MEQDNLLPEFCPGARNERFPGRRNRPQRFKRRSLSYGSGLDEEAIGEAVTGVYEGGLRPREHALRTGVLSLRNQIPPILDAVVGTPNLSASFPQYLDGRPLLAGGKPVHKHAGPLLVPSGLIPHLANFGAMAQPGPIPHEPNADQRRGGDPHQDPSQRPASQNGHPDRSRSGCFAQADDRISKRFAHLRSARVAVTCFHPTGVADHFA